MTENATNTGISSDLETLSVTGKPPSSRVRDAQAALAIVERLWEEGESRRLKRAQVDRMADGAPPYDQSLLDANGQSYRSNTPSMDGASLLQVANTTFYDLFNAAKTFFDITLNGIDDLSRRVDASRCLTELVDKKLKEWPNLYFRLWILISDYVRHGQGFLFWQQTGWQFRNVRYHRVLVPDSSEIDLETMDRLVILQEMTVTQLYDQIRNPKAASALGWNTKEVVDSIRTAVPVDRQHSRDPVEVEASLRDNDMWIDSMANRVQMAHLYVREFSGKWSHYIVNRNGTKGAGYIYEHREEYDKFEHFCAPFFFEVLDGSWNGASGLGKTIYPVIRHGDRILNSLLDAVYLRTGVNLQAKDASSMRRLSYVQIGGGVNVIPPGLEAINSNILGDLSGALSVGRVFNNMLERNTGIYRQSMQAEGGNPETAFEVKAKLAQSTTLSNSAVDRWYVQENRLGMEIWRRMQLDRGLMTEFLEKLAPYGVTRKELTGESEVSAVRALGNGSAAVRQESVFGLMPLSGSFPEAGRQRWIDDAIAVKAGQSKVARYNPRPPERTSPDQQQWEAMEENGTLSSGAPVTRYSTQNDFTHAETHLRFMGSAAQSLQSGAPPIKVLSLLDAVAPHTQIHLQMLSQDKVRGGQVKQMVAIFKRFAKVADDLRRMVQMQAKKQNQQNAKAQAQAQQGQQDPKLDEARMHVAERTAKMQMTQAEHVSKMQMDREKMQADVALQAQKTQADIAMRQAQAQVNLQEDIATKNR